MTKPRPIDSHGLFSRDKGIGRIQILGGSGKFADIVDPEFFAVIGN